MLLLAVVLGGLLHDTNPQIDRALAKVPSPWLDPTSKAPDLAVDGTDGATMYWSPVGRYTDGCCTLCRRWTLALTHGRIWWLPGGANCTTQGLAFPRVARPVRWG